MRKRLTLQPSHPPFWVVWRHPVEYLRHFVLGDIANPSAIYWTSIFITALLVSLYQFFSILPARQALVRIAVGVLVVYGGAFVLLYGLTFATQQLLTLFNYSDNFQRLPSVFLSTGPWIAGIAFVACMTSAYWPCDILALMAIIILIVRLATTLNISIFQATVILSAVLAPMLAVILYWSWARGWNLFPFW